MSQNEDDYFEKRAEQELAMACRASETAAVQAHYTLACAYLDKVYPEQSTDQAR